MFRSIIYLLLYINEPAVIIGRSQNTFQEIDHEFIRRKGIHVVRRISGGGAVYHDYGNLNFSFITKYEKTNVLNFRKFTAPVIRALHGLGVPAELSEGNDIVAFGKKISGNAQRRRRVLLQHGTLLVDADFESMSKALRMGDEGKAKLMERLTTVRSEASRVINVEEVSEALTMGFEEILSMKLVKGKLTTWEEGRVQELKEKYKFKSWIRKVCKKVPN